MRNEKLLTRFHAHIRCVSCTHSLLNSFRFLLLLFALHVLFSFYVSSFGVWIVCVCADRLMPLNSFAQHTWPHLPITKTSLIHARLCECVQRIFSLSSSYSLQHYLHYHYYYYDYFIIILYTTRHTHTHQQMFPHLDDCCECMQSKAYDVLFTQAMNSNSPHRISVFRLLKRSVKLATSAKLDTHLYVRFVLRIFFPKLDSRVSCRVCCDDVTSSEIRRNSIKT